ncbi:protein STRICTOSIDINE SYNTHASE-LIKE 10-like [Macadamia integrifolia]|uniref:protein STRICTOSIDINE SYNTHASE-LIKE 10-like n=1 Tax=Macadamia integrifolia TaxID=60698 RepID=UPI001C4E569B|nr:protein STRICTOSIDINE SYNTHASE-LIKE 10-like [Macadamia integrifolia]
MKSIFIFVAAILAVLSIYLSTKPSPSFKPPLIAGAYDKLHDAEVIHLPGEAVGPESIAFDPNGEGPYTGVSNGRILKWEGNEGWTEFAFTSPQRNECEGFYSPKMEHLCGRPLGLRFHPKTGDLYIANAYLGLQKVGPNGGLATQLITEAEGEPLSFTNDLDIDKDEDVIYFTDSSTNFQRRQFMSTVLSLDKTGRLMQYDISSKQVTVLLKGLLFPNGVALSKDNTFLLIAETTTSRILRLWLQGPKAGTLDVFTELPGFPDNIRRNSKGEFWVALYSKTGKVENWALSNPWFGKLFLKLPDRVKRLQSLIGEMKAHATAVKLNEEGKVVEVLEDSQGRTLRFISEVEENNGNLWFGSVLMPFMGRYNLH